MTKYWVLAALAPAVAFAAGPFDGTWKIQTDSIKMTGKPSVYELKDGTYKCVSCAPSWTIKADGTDQKVAGQSYYDTVAVRVVDAHSVETTSKLNGKTIATNSMVVSADGNTLTEAFHDMSGAQTATMKQVSKRVAPGRAGSHAVSGSWTIETVPEVSEIAATIAYKMSADGMQMHWNGQSYDAKFDGKKVLTANDPGKTWVSLKRISNDTVEETDSRDNKVTDVYRMTVSADGKTMSVVDEDKLHGTTATYRLVKQP